MLNQFSLDAVGVLAKTLTEKGIALGPVNGTLLSEADGALTFVTRGPENGLVTDGVVKSEVAETPSVESYGRYLLTQSTTPGLDGVQSDHSIIMDRGVNLVADSVAKSLAFARGVVQPFVGEICDKVAGQLNAAVAAESGCLTIIPDAIPEIWDNAGFISMYRKFDNVPFDNVQLNRIHPAMDYSEIVARLRTGSPIVDKVIDLLVASVGQNLVSDVYNSVFSKADQTRDGTLYQYSSLNDYLGLGDNADRNIPVIIFLLANRLSEDIPEGINISIDTYQSYLTLILKQAGRALNALEKSQADRQANGRMVKSWPGVSADKVDTVSGQIRVDEKLYKQWLEKGGAPEILFGLYISNEYANSVIDYNSILDPVVAARFVTEWNQFYAAREALALSLRQNSVHRAVSDALHSFVRDTVESPLLSTDREILHSRIIERMRQVRPEHYADEDLLILYVVCDVFFPASDAKFILLNMAACEKSNPGVKPREASLDAMLELLADWLVDNFIIVPAA